MSNDSSKNIVAEPKKIGQAKSVVSHEKSVPWSPFVAVLAAVVLYFAAQFIAIMLVSIYPRTHHWTTSAANDWLTNSVMAQFVFTLLAEGLTVLGLWQFLRHYKFSFRGIGLKRPKAEDILYALAGFALYFVPWAILFGALTSIFPSLNSEQQNVGFQTAHGASELVLTAVSLVIIPPVVEEILMRGFLYTSLKKSLPKVGAALLTSLIFAAAHLPENGGSGPLWIGAADTFVLSLVLVFLREKTGRLYASMGVHGMVNLLAFVQMFRFLQH
jgi:membrane protease YdiL (CAAX protease family)